MRAALRLSPMAVLVAALCGAQTSAPPVSKVFDQQLTTLEREFVALADAMPAEKFNFAPTDGEFKGVRTYGQQVSHTATALYAISAAVLGEKSPTEMGQNENGPAALKTKDDIMKYLKDAFAYAHKAMAALSEQNLTELVAAPFGSRKVPRVAMANLALWHSFDHYGQMVVYARMNGIIPPASRR